MRPASIRRPIVRSESTMRRSYRRPNRVWSLSECGTLGDPVSMLYGPMDPNERFRARRAQMRRRKRRRRAAVLAFALLVLIAVVMGARFVGDTTTGTKQHRAAAATAPALPVVATRPRPLPVEIRGLHV